MLPFADAKRASPKGGRGRKPWNPALHPKGAGGRFIPTAERIDAATAKAGRNVTEHVRFSRVYRASAIRPFAKVDVRNYNYSVSNQAVSHTLKKHGNPITEAKRGHLAVTKADFRLLPSTVKTGQVRAPDPHGSPHERFVVVNEIAGVGYHAVFEVKTGKKRLELWTLRKKKGAW